MKNLSLIFLIIFAFAVSASPIRIMPVDKDIMNLIFNAQLEEAEQLINAEIVNQPSHPKYYALKTPLFFYSRYFSGGAYSNDSLLQLVIDNGKKAVEVSENIQETPEVMFYLGMAYGFMGRAHTILGDRWDGYLATRKSRSYMEDVLELEPNFSDAYLALGVLEYYTDVQITGFYRALAWILGMSGDREKGLDYFERVAENGDLLKNEAKFILGMVYRYYENDFQQAYTVLEELIQKYPDNNFLANQYQQAQLMHMIDIKGVDFLVTEMDSLIEKYTITNSFVLNAMGYYLMGQNRLDDALTVFQVNLKLYPHVANCYDSLAECYMNREENELAIKYYRIAYEKLPADTTINDNFRQRLKDGIENRLEDLGTSV